MSKRVIVLCDGTWETVNTAEVWEVTDEAYEKLLNGEEPKHLDESDIINTKEVQ